MECAASVLLACQDLCQRWSGLQTCPASEAGPPQSSGVGVDMRPQSVALCRVDSRFLLQVGNAAPLENELEHWLPLEGGDFDLVVVASQENDHQSENSMVGLEADRHGGKLTLTVPTIHNMDNIWGNMLVARLGPKWTTVQNALWARSRKQKAQWGCSIRRALAAPCGRLGLVCDMGAAAASPWLACALAGTAHESAS